MGIRLRDLRSGVRTLRFDQLDHRIWFTAKYEECEVLGLKLGPTSAYLMNLGREEDRFYNIGYTSETLRPEMMVEIANIEISLHPKRHSDA